MGLNGHKKVGVGVGIVAVFGAIATVIGFYSDVKDIFSKDDNNTQEVVVTSIVTQEETQAPVVEETQEEVITTTEEITEPPVTEPSVVYLADLEPVECEYFSNEDNVEDTIGNQYIGKILYTGSGFEDDGYAIYYLGGKYTTLSGTIAVSNRTTNSYTGQISIFTDDNVIYNTEEMGRISTPVDFSVNVENCQWLKILKMGDYFNGNGTWFILYNWKLE